MERCNGLSPLTGLDSASVLVLEDGLAKLITRTSMGLALGLEKTGALTTVPF